MEAGHVCQLAGHADALSTSFAAKRESLRQSIDGLSVQIPAYTPELDWPSLGVDEARLSNNERVVLSGHENVYSRLKMLIFTHEKVNLSA